MKSMDEQIGKNVARARGAMSQRELASRMRDADWPKWSHLTVAAVERGERPLRLSEAASIAAILNLQSIQSITAPEGEFEYLETLQALHDAVRELALKADKVLRLQRTLTEELGQELTSSISDQHRMQLEFDLRLTPTEVVYEVVSDQLPVLKAAVEKHGYFAQLLAEAVEQNILSGKTYDMTISSLEEDAHG